MIRRVFRRETRAARVKRLMETGGPDTFEALSEGSDMDVPEDSGTEMASASELDVGPGPSTSRGRGQPSAGPINAGMKWFAEFVQELFIPVIPVGQCVGFVSSDLPAEVATDAMVWPCWHEVLCHPIPGISKLQCQDYEGGTKRTVA